jgi:hypothetical protein
MVRNLSPGQDSTVYRSSARLKCTPTSLPTVPLWITGPGMQRWVTTLIFTLICVFVQCSPLIPSLMEVFLYRESHSHVAADVKEHASFFLHHSVKKFEAFRLLFKLDRQCKQFFACELFLFHAATFRPTFCFVLK